MSNEPLDEEAIFQAARALASPEARADYLAQACGDNAALRQRVEALLRVHDEEQSFLQTLPPGTQAEPPPENQRATESPGSQIGSYKLLELIGEGGMGSVWMAQQTEPVKRLVALKLIKPGLDSTQVLARFEAERQALALMDHPNIARVFDGGSTPDGRPYFVMELVKGVPITKYADEHRLTPQQRLELFVPVCQAIQHAHQKGIIHRDIKPSNVLVALYDDHPVPKVIDFGVAKATGQQLTERTLHTGFGVVVGTIEYMSPEQASLNQLDIDTRSDVYALGVLLYELLAGSPPFPRKELEKAGVLEMLRLIREQEPSRPSTKLSTADGLPTLAANRGTEPAKLTRLVRGELDWIVMRALEKDRSRRYETANAFAMDVQRYLADEPVQACPPSVGYRLGKVLRRHKGAVLAAALVLLTLVVGIIGTTWGLFQARDAAAEMSIARAEAVEDRDRKAEAERQAKQEEDRAKHARDDAIAQRNRAMHQQYALGMYPVSRLWREGSHLQVRKLLDALRPGPGEKDLRDWEWHYQDRLSRGALRTLKGQSDRDVLDMTQSLAYSPDGRWLATCGGPNVHNGELFLWNVVTGAEVRRFHDQGHELHLLARVAFSPDGKTLATSDWVSTVHLWDVASGRLLRTLESQMGTVGIQSLRFSPDGQTLVSTAGNEEGTRDWVTVWEAGGGRQLGRWGTDAISSVAFHPEGQLLVVTRSAVTLHEPATGRVLRRLPLGTVGQPPPRPQKRDEDDPDAAAISPDGTRVAVAVEDGIQLWDLALGSKGRLLKGIARKGINELIFSPDGLRLASARKDGTVETWDFRENYPRRSEFRVVEEGVIRLAFSPDGLRLAAAGRDGAILIWDAAANGQETRRMRGLGGRLGIRRVAFTPDGRQFLALPYNPDGPHEMPYLCDVVTGQKLPGQVGGNGPVAYSPDGRWLASGCKEGIRLWDAATVREVRTIHTPFTCARLNFVGEGRLVSVLYGPDTKRSRVVATVKLWDVASGRELATIDETTVVSPDGRRLAVRTTGSAKNPGELWMGDVGQWRTGEENPPVTHRPHARTFVGFAFSPDGKLLATTGQDPLTLPSPPSDGGEGRVRGSWSVKLWDAATLKEVRSIPWPKDQYFGNVVFSPDGRFLAASGTGLVKVWEVTGREVFTAEGKEEGGTLTLSPNGQHLVALGNGRVKVWEVTTGRERFTSEWKGQLPTVAFSPNGQYLSAAGDGSLTVWEVTGRVVLSQRGTGRELTPRINSAFSPDSSAVAVSDIKGSNRVWDLATGRERFALGPGSRSPAGLIDAGIFAMFGSGVAFSPDGRRLVTGNPVMRVWDAANGAELHRPGHLGAVAGMAVSPVGRILATGQDQVVHLWELETWKPLGTLGGHNGNVSAIAFSPDGRLLAAGDGIWELPERPTALASLPPPGGERRVRASGAVQPPKHRLEGHPNAVGVRAFSPDGKQLFSFDTGTVKVWDVASGRELSSSKLAPEMASGVAFSPDGKLLACGESNGVRLWDISRGREVRVLAVEDKLRRGITISALAFSSDGRRLAALGVGIIRIWDMRTFQELYTVAPVEAAADLAFSPDGGWLVTGEGPQPIKRISTPWVGSETVGGFRSDLCVVFHDGRPLTTEREVEREALGLLDQLFERPLPRKDVLDHLRADPGLPEPVRQAALRLGAQFREEEDPNRYARTARRLVRSAHLPAAWHRQALSQAEAACALAPADGYCLTALGMAQYRLGQDREALQTLARADRVNVQKLGYSALVDLALLALVHHRLGHQNEAEEFVCQLHERMQNPNWKQDEEAVVLCREAELRILGMMPSWPAVEETRTAPGEKPTR